MTLENKKINVVFLNLPKLFGGLLEKKKNPKIKTYQFIFLLVNKQGLSHNQYIDREAGAPFRRRPLIRMSGFCQGDRGLIPGNGSVSTFVPFPNFASLFNQTLPFLFFIFLFGFSQVMIAPIITNYLFLANEFS